MICPECGKKMKPGGTLDETCQFYKCACGYWAAKHIHRKRKFKAPNKGILKLDHREVKHE